MSSGEVSAKHWSLHLPQLSRRHELRGGVYERKHVLLPLTCANTGPHTGPYTSPNTGAHSRAPTDPGLRA